jgi:hypothetical protein
MYCRDFARDHLLNQSGYRLSLKKCTDVAECPQRACQPWRGPVMSSHQPDPTLHDGKYLDDAAVGLLDPTQWSLPPSKQLSKFFREHPVSTVEQQRQIGEQLKLSAQEVGSWLEKQRKLAQNKAEKALDMREKLGVLKIAAEDNTRVAGLLVMKVDTLKLELRVVAQQLFPGMSARAPMFNMNRVPLIEKIVELEKIAEEKGVAIQRLTALPGASPPPPANRPTRRNAPERERVVRPSAKRVRRRSSAAPDGGSDSNKSVPETDEDEEGEVEDTDEDEDEDEDTDEDEEDDVPCFKCGGRDSAGENLMILCDSENCNQGWHLQCLTPPLSSVPSGRWFCSTCEMRVVRTRTGRKSMGARWVSL